MTQRGRVALGVLALWAVGMAVLVRREYFRPNVEMLAEVAARVSPGAVFFAVMQGDRQVGFASSTIDTASSTITASDYLVADTAGGGAMHRVQSHATVSLSRAFRVRTFAVDLVSDQPPTHTAGQMEGDSVVLGVGAAGSRSRGDTVRVHVGGPILLPILVPLAVALGEPPKVGRSYLLPIFDPVAMAQRDVRFVVRAESSFVVNDSAVFDASSGRWHGVQPDSVRAWRVSVDSGPGFSGWIDEQGRVVGTTQMGFRLVREPYEVAFENWRIANASSGGLTTSDSNIVVTTLLAAKRRATHEIAQLVLRVSNADLNGFAVDGERQVLRGDTLTITRESLDTLEAANTVYRSRRQGALNLTHTRDPEPMVESRNGEIVALAKRLAADGANSVIIAERINRWVHDSLIPTVSTGVPDALRVLHDRRGDCNEYTQLYVALARAAGLSARAATGLVLVDGKFYYHAWPEVFLFRVRRWVAVDPMLGQFPADASHIRLATGGLLKQAELFRLISTLHLDVMPVQAAHPSP